MIPSRTDPACPHCSRPIAVGEEVLDVNTPTGLARVHARCMRMSPSQSSPVDRTMVLDDGRVIPLGKL